MHIFNRYRSSLCARAIVRATLLLSLSLSVHCTSTVFAENWPTWRGANGIGVSVETDLPTKWSRDEGVRWRVALPEPGNSTPVIWDDKIFVTQPVKEKNLRNVICFARSDGHVLWTAGVPYREEEPTHRTNHFCSASPVTDGERVIAWFGSAGLHCYDMNGKHLWSRELGKQNHMWGYAASPVIYKDLCLLNFGPGDREFVIAVDKTTGETVWQVGALDSKAEQALAVPGTDGNAEKEKNQDGPRQRGKILRGSWSTPLLIRAGERDELVVSHPRRVTAYDPLTGKELWLCRGLGPLIYSSPIWGDGALVSMGGFFGASLAVRPGGNGDVTDSHRLWHELRSPLRLGSGVIYNGHIYVDNMQGVVQCLKLETGELVWEERHAGSEGNNASWSSMVLCGDRLYHLNQSGDTFVFKASPKYELLAKNSIGEQTNSSIVISKGEIFIRTHEALWCIGK